jgi:hypothetical protein
MEIIVMIIELDGDDDRDNYHLRKVSLKELLRNLLGELYCPVCIYVYIYTYKHISMHHIMDNYDGDNGDIHVLRINTDFTWGIILSC